MAAGPHLLGLVLGPILWRKLRPPNSPPLAFCQKLCGSQASSVGKPRPLQAGSPQERRYGGHLGRGCEWLGGGRRGGVPGVPGQERGEQRVSSEVRGGLTRGSPGRRARSPAGSPAPGTRCGPRPARCTAACSCTSWRTSSLCLASARCTPGGTGRLSTLPRFPSRPLQAPL